MKALIVALAISATPVLATVPGKLISASPIAGAPVGAKAWRIRYASRDRDNRPITVSGVVIVPRGRAPAAGRPIIAWTHGAVGVADQCAPSMAPTLFPGIAGLEAMLAAGYVVAASDYQGLGSPGPHPFLVGDATAHAVLDIVRTAPQVTRSDAGKRFAVWGESQGGHAALWTGQLARRYAPDLELVAVAAAAPPTNLKANLTGGTNAAVRALLTAYTADSWSKVFGIKLSTIVRPVGADLITRLAKNCVSLDGFKARTQIGLVRLTGQLRGVDISASPRWGALIRANSVPAAGFTVPVFIAQGGKDVIVAPAVTHAYMDRLCRARVRLTRLDMPAGDHVTIGKTTASATIAWIGDRFAGAPAPNDC